SPPSQARPAAHEARAEQSPAPRPPPPPQRAAGEVARTDGHSRIFSSPLARRLAKDAGIELARIQGPGPRGRIVARDVEAAKSGKGLAPAAAPAAAPLPVQAPADDKIRALFEPGSYDVVAHDNVRRVIARRLVEAKLTIPHFYLTLDCSI